MQPNAALVDLRNFESLIRCRLDVFVKVELSLGFVLHPVVSYRFLSSASSCSKFSDI